MSELDVLKQLTQYQRTLDQVQVIERPGITGSWTPAFVGTSTAGTFTYTAQIGRWMRVSNQIFIHAIVGISAIAVAPVGSMYISGLPFTAANIGMDYSLSLGFVGDINYSATAKELTALVRLNATEIWLGESFDNAAWARFPAANFTNANATLELSGFYQIP